MNDDPLRVIPDDFGQRKKLLAEINSNFTAINNGNAPYEINIRGGLSPASDLILQKLKDYYKDKLQPGENLMEKVLTHVKAKRMILDETKRVGIATYMPKDPKNQDSTELNGDIDYSKLPMYGDPNHPLVQAYKGEFNVANRGVMEFVEILKLQREFLYDLLTASQERRIKPKNSTLIPIDTVIIGHTNMEELEEKLQDGKMKAFFNRAVEIRVPYLLDEQAEMEIYKKGFLKQAAKRGLTIAPQALEVAAEWAVRTRKDPQIIAQSGKSSDAKGREGLYGASPRFLQAMFSNILVHSQVEQTKTVTPFVVLRSIKYLLNKGVLKDEKNLNQYVVAVEVGKQKLTDKVEADIMKALMSEKDVLKNYLQKYVNNLKIWKIEPKSADSAYIGRVEDRLNPPVSYAAAQEYRNNLLLKLDAMDSESISLDVLKDDPSLRFALNKIMFEDFKNSLDGASQNGVQLNQLIENMKHLGYNEVSAKEAIRHITTRGGIV